MIRKIIQIDEEKCDGCGLCVAACHEGAIELIDGKAKLVSDEYCDGLGDCLPQCPQGAITMIERKAAPFDEVSVRKRQKALAEKRNEELTTCSCPGSMGKVIEKDGDDQCSCGHDEEKEESLLGCGCPGSMARVLEKNEGGECSCEQNGGKQVQAQSCCRSELRQWPVQLSLVNPGASYLKNAHLLIAADCTAYAYGSFHQEFIRDRITLIGCPKLDDSNYYTEKLTEIFKKNTPKSITVVRMEVPCCGGIIRAVKEAMLRTETIVPYNEVVISTEGHIINNL